MLRLTPECDAYIVWTNIPSVPWSLPILLERPDIVSWQFVSNKEWALPLLERYPDRVIWELVPFDEWTTQLPEEHLRKRLVAINAKHAQTIARWLVNPDQADWWRASSAEWAIPVLDKYPDRVFWYICARNEWSLPLLTKHWEIINWSMIDVQSWMLPLFMEHPDLIRHAREAKQWMLPVLIENPSFLQPIANSHQLKEWMLPVFMRHPSLAISDQVKYVLFNSWLLPVFMEHPDLLLVHGLWHREWMLPAIMKHASVVANIWLHQEWMLPALDKYHNRINWRSVHQQEWMLPIFMKHPQYFYSHRFVEWAMPLYVAHESVPDWSEIHELNKKFALPIINAHPHRVNWSHFYNRTWALPTMIVHSSHINWEQLLLSGTIRKFLHDNYAMQLSINRVYPAYGVSLVKYRAKRNKLLLRGIAKYLFHPIRIQQWIEAGNDLEDYMP